MSLCPTFNQIERNFRAFYVFYLFSRARELLKISERIFIERSLKYFLSIAGVIYFINVDKTTKKPPKVGHPFRCYSESHYSSVNREQPIICKVKEWPCDDVKCWRLYHYYLGKTGRPRKRNPNGTEGSFSSEEDPSPNVSGEDYDRKRGPEEDGEFDQRSTKRFKSEYEQR
jgi:hypothetical protein